MRYIKLFLGKPAGLRKNRLTNTSQLRTDGTWEIGRGVLTTAVVPQRWGALVCGSWCAAASFPCGLVPGAKGDPGHSPIVQLSNLPGTNHLDIVVFEPVSGEARVICEVETRTGATRTTFDADRRGAVQRIAFDRVCAPISLNYPMHRDEIARRKTQETHNPETPHEGGPERLAERAALDPPRKGSSGSGPA